MTKKLDWLFALVFTVATVAIGAVANALPLNGLTTGVISDSFKTYFVPAGYVFSIWGVIYLGLFAFTYYVWSSRNEQKKVLDEILPWYYRGAIANSLWIFAWHYQQFAVTGVLIVTLLITLIAIQLILVKYPAKSSIEKWLVHVPFNIYLGWASVATIANIQNVLWLYGFTGFGIAGPWWAAVLILVAGGLAIVVKQKMNNVAFAFVVIWAVVGIMVKFSDQRVMMLAGALTIFGIAAELIRSYLLARKKI